MEDETVKRMGRSWFAAQANNWDEAGFEVREARGMVQAGALRGGSNQSRVQGITAFNAAFFDPLNQAAQAGDPAQYPPFAHQHRPAQLHRIVAEDERPVTVSAVAELHDACASARIQPILSHVCQLLFTDDLVVRESVGMNVAQTKVIRRAVVDLHLGGQNVARGLHTADRARQDGSTHGANVPRQYVLDGHELQRLPARQFSVGASILFSVSASTGHLLLNLGQPSFDQLLD